MEIKSNGCTYNIGTIWNTSNSSDGVRIFYLETKQVIARLSGNGLKDKFLRIMEKGGMTDE